MRRALMYTTISRLGPHWGAEAPLLHRISYGVPAARSPIREFVRTHRDPVAPAPRLSLLDGRGRGAAPTDAHSGKAAPAGVSRHGRSRDPKQGISTSSTPMYAQ